MEPLQFPVQVFIRIRPLVPKEIEAKHESIEYNVNKYNEKGDNNNNQLQDLSSLALSGVAGIGTKIYKGFQNILLPKDNNYTTFRSCVLPYLRNMLAGESTCLFAYGHTGSGKTHTIFGYGKENPGMYHLYARALFKTLSKLRKGKNDKDDSKDDNEVTVQVRFTELYQSKLFDLLSVNKQQCFVREDRNGDVHVRSDPIKSKTDGKVRQFPITGIECKDEDELLLTIKNGVGSRNVGKSTLHDKSSRSHAFLEFEIVNRKLINKRKELVELDADILKEELINVQSREVKRLKGVKKGILKEIRQILNNDNKKHIGGKMIFIDLAGNEYGRDAIASMEAMEEKNEKINKGDATEKTEVTDAMKKERQEKQKILMQEQRERTEINQSLLSLKECIRGLHEKKNHIGFRNSKLTLYLKNHLKGEKSKAIMISNIGPSKKYVKQTINTLKYTQLVAQA